MQCSLTNMPENSSRFSYGISTEVTEVAQNTASLVANSEYLSDFEIKAV